MTDTELFTLGQIADILAEPPARINYIIAKHRIKPVKRIGIFRLFDSKQIKAIKQGCFNIQIRGGNYGN